ncbi:MAG TPA: hypothetical protein VGR22_08965 [Thermomicrobiales bacterium]|nr:hypothetical protein [Thermomicrobiales bacterium]
MTTTVLRRFALILLLAFSPGFAVLTPLAGSAQGSARNCQVTGAWHLVLDEGAIDVICDLRLEADNADDGAEDLPIGDEVARCEQIAVDAGIKTWTTTTSSPPAIVTTI